MSFLLLAAYAAIAIILYIGFIILYQFTYWKHRRMLHAELVPVIGINAPIFFRTASFPVHAQNLQNKFSGARYYGAFKIGTPLVVIKDSHLIREVCVKSFEHFTDHDSFVSEEMDPIVGRNLLSLKGQRWKDVRSTLSPSFTAIRMKVLFELIAECSKDFVNYFVDHPDVAKDFEAKDAFTRYTNDVIATAAFGVKVNSMSDRNNEFYLHGKAAVSFDGFRFLKFLLMRIFPRLMRLTGATFLPKKTDMFFRNLIKETVRMRMEKGIVRPDMIHLLMQAMNKENSVQLTVNDIVGQAFFFFLAGFDSVSSLMCFMAHELAANPNIQEKLFQEIDQLFKDGNEITYNSLSQMKYLDMVVNETLRMYPTTPLTNRVCVKDYKFPPSMKGYPEYNMEKGTLILIPIFGFHRDPKYFPEPEKFLPERFSEENKGNIDPYAYMPFGLGPRQCIGYRFAVMETKMVIINILRKFIIKFTDKTQHPVVFDKKTFNVTADGGFWLKFEERKKNN